MKSFVKIALSSVVMGISDGVTPWRTWQGAATVRKRCVSGRYGFLLLRYLHRMQLSAENEEWGMFTKL